MHERQMDNEKGTPSVEDDHLMDGEAALEVEGARDPASTAEQWKKTLKKVINCVVVLKVTQTRAFDTEGAGSSYATGFVVDRTRGVILTNRHVVTPGPIVAEAVFQNREEVRVHPIYYDPVHDFGFFRFDPSELQFMSLDDVPLCPDAAAVGLDIRVVGNDSGEKISILSGTLARLDRDAPHYGRKHYNDFNTHYIQAASGTKGGSSGSPVVDVLGRAVALNAGGKHKAASAYYLPLKPVVRALRSIQQSYSAMPGQGSSWSAPVVPRGDLQTTFLFKGFDEAKRLGLRSETEAEARAAQEKARTGLDDHGAGVGMEVDASCTTGIGMLVVENTVPDGPCDGKLEPGDVLLRLDGTFVSDFFTMERLMDSKVEGPGGGSVRVEVERGGIPISLDVAVQNLHAVTPAEFIEVGGGTVHELSYMQARNNRSRVGQVYVSEPGYLLGKAGLRKHSIITSLDGKPTDCFAEFRVALLGLEHGQRVPMEYFTFEERHRRKNVILHVDWCWYGAPVRWVRNDGAGVWDPTTLWPKNFFQQQAQHAQQQVMCSSSPRISSPRIEASCATSLAPSQNIDRVSVRPDFNHTLNPKTLNPKTGLNDDGTVEKSSLLSETLPLSIKIPRAHSVPDVAASHDLEKVQAGVTALGEDARLRAAVARGQGCTLPNGAGAVHAVPAAVPHPPDDPSNWRVLLEQSLRSAMVAVDVEIPLVALVDGVHSRSFAGCGIIVHLCDHFGVVLVDRNTVTVGPGDIMLSFGAFPAELPARVRFLHPLHNFSLLSFDPRQLSSEARNLLTAVALAPRPPLRRGDSVELVCLSKSLRVLHRTSTITNPEMPVIITQAEVPRFRAVHEEVVKLDQDFGLLYSGILADREGRMRALWGSYSEQVDKEEREWTAGLPTAVFLPWVEGLVQGLLAEKEGFEGGRMYRVPTVPVLDAELEPLLLSKAAQFGLPREWISRLVTLDPERRQVLRVRSTVAGSDAQRILKDSDMILAVQGRPVSSFADVECIIASVAATAGEDNDNDERREHWRRTKRVRRGPSSKKMRCSPTPPPTPLPSVRLTLFRSGGRIEDVSVRLGLEDGLGTDRVVHWCGAQLQAPHRGVRELGFLPEKCSGVYISRWHHGSPAHRYGLYALHWVLEVNGASTPSLDDFLEAVGTLKDGADVRLRVVHFETNKVKVLTLKTDLRYWPTWELRLDPAKGEWARMQYG